MMRKRFSAFLLAAPLCADAAWPQLPVPPQARIEPVGTEIRLNGIPMRMQRVLTARQAQEVARHYRDALGSRHASERLPDRLVLSQGRGDYFISVSIRPLAPGLTEALVSVADAREARRAVGRPLGLRLPAESAVLSDMESVDGGMRSRQLVLSNTHAIPTNLLAISRELAIRGMRPDGPPLRATASGHAQLFRGEGREAQLTVFLQDGGTRIVLTMIEKP
ncbi:MAG: hypothetical protein ACK4SR_09490 [Thiobacillus sp.]